MKGIWTILIRLLGNILTGISPELRGFFSDMLDKAEEKAKATANPFDDILVSLAKGLLGLD